MTITLDKDGLASLVERVREAKGYSNELDIAIELALFKPDERYCAVRANAANTKVIYTDRSGKDKTCWARDWTLNEANRKQAADAIRALKEVR